MPDESLFDVLAFSVDKFDPVKDFFQVDISFRKPDLTVTITHQSPDFKKDSVGHPFSRTLIGKNPFPFDRGTIGLDGTDPNGEVTISFLKLVARKRKLIPWWG